MNKLYIGAASIAVASILGGLAYTSYASDPFADCRVSSVAGGANVIGGPFELVDHHGNTVTEADVMDKPSLVYFGYTFCPDICPLDTARNADAVYKLDDQGIEVQPVFITIDPARDTPEVVAEYVEVFHPRMIGLTGSEAQVKAASQAYKTYYQKQDSDDEYYLVDHSTSAYFMMPEHGFISHFGRAHTSEMIAETMACVINNA